MRQEGAERLSRAILSCPLARPAVRSAELRRSNPPAGWNLGRFKKSQSAVTLQSHKKRPGQKQIMEIQRPPEVASKNILPSEKKRDGQFLPNVLLPITVEIVEGKTVFSTCFQEKQSNSLFFKKSEIQSQEYLPRTKWSVHYVPRLEPPPGPTA